FRNIRADFHPRFQYLFRFIVLVAGALRLFGTTTLQIFRPQSPPHILTLVIAAGTGALSMNVFLPSLPGMARYFGVDYAIMQLTVSVYLVATAALQLIIG